MLRKDLHEANRLSWNAALEAHNSHKGDQAAYFRAGGCKLYPEERELLGDVRGLTIVHLQCNAGQDSLSLASLGAQVTGVDISDDAIAFAERLSAESGVPANFHRADVYDWLSAAADTDERFDVAFSSYGTLCWLSDLTTWARGVAAVLRPGGRLVVVDYHPLGLVFDQQLQLHYPYFNQGGPLTWADGVADYVGDTGGESPYGEHQAGATDFKNPYPVHEFQWAIGEIASAVLDAGLMLTALREYPYANGYRMFDGMQELPGGRWVLPEDLPSLPLMYAIAARKP